MPGFGKIIKKTDHKMKAHVNVEEYPWLNFKEENILLTDNERQSLICQRTHTADELDSKVHLPSQFLASFFRKAKALTPIDMTHDFESALKESLKRKRRRMLGEEEAMALELAELSLSDDHGSMMSWKERNKKEKAKKEEKHFGLQTPEHQKEDAGFQSEDEKSDLNSEKNEDKAEGDQKSWQEKKAAAESVSEAFPKNDLLKDEEDSQTQKYQSLRQNVDDIQTQQAQTPQSLHEKGNPEEIQEEELEKKSENTDTPESIENQSLKTKNLEKTHTEKNGSGYETGYKHGLEKAYEDNEIKRREEQEAFSSTIQNLVHANEQIFDESKNIFLEVAKLCAEKIIQKELSMSDEALMNLFESVIENFKSENSFIVEASSKDIERIKRLIGDTLKDKMTFEKNESFSSGQIFVKSKKAVSKTELEEMITTILEKIQDDLFEEPSEQPKAG